VSNLAVATLLDGLVQWYTGGQSIANNISPGLVNSGLWLGIPPAVWLVALAAVIVWYLLDLTRSGRSLYAIGENLRAARLVGMPAARYTLVGFTLSGVLAGVAGVVLTSRTAGATDTDGTTLLFPALAAVFLGATAIKPGRFNVWGTVFGVALVAVSVSGLTLAGAADWVAPVFNGAALALAVGLSTLLRRRDVSLAIPAKAGTRASSNSCKTNDARGASQAPERRDGGAGDAGSSRRGEGRPRPRVGSVHAGAMATLSDRLSSRLLGQPHQFFTRPCAFRDVSPFP
jgi:hypothetical protein